jgi:hypothetical protein
MINWFSRCITKEQINELFSRNISPELIDAVKASKPSKLNELSEGPVEFIFVVVQGATPNETGQHLGSVAAFAKRNGWMVQDFLCNLVVLVRGVLPFKEPLAPGRSAVAQQLIQSMRESIKIVHGAETASYGVMGGENRLTYGVLLPSFLDVMSALHALPYGQALELTGDQAGTGHPGPSPA